MSVPDAPTFSAERTSDYEITLTASHATLSVGIFAWSSLDNRILELGTLSSPGSIIFHASENKASVFYAVTIGPDGFSVPTFAWAFPLAPDDLLGSVHAHFNSYPTLSGLVPGGMWTGEIPETGENGEDLEIPYGSVEVNGTEFEWTTENSYLEKSRLAFTFWASGAKEASAIMRAFQDSYDWETIPVTSAEFVSSHCLHRRLQSVPARDREGNLVFVGSLTYEVILHRQDP